MPSILDAPPITYAIISHSHYSKALRYQILGKRDLHATTFAEKHRCSLMVASAWFNLTRLVFHPDGWDPSPWSGYRTTLPEPLMIPPTDPASQSVSSPFSLLYDELYPSVVSPRLRILIDEIRELLDVEEVKFALGATRDELTTQVFRWSSLWKLAIRTHSVPPVRSQ